MTSLNTQIFNIFIPQTTHHITAASVSTTTVNEWGQVFAPNHLILPPSPPPNPAFTTYSSFLRLINTLNSCKELLYSKRRSSHVGSNIMWAYRVQCKEYKKKEADLGVGLFYIYFQLVILCVLELLSPSTSLLCSILQTEWADTLQQIMNQTLWS